MTRFLQIKALHSAYRPDDELSDRAITWLRNERHQPFFLWLHYFGPHEKPQETDDIFEERRRQLAAYDDDVVFADTQVGRVLTTLDQLGLTDHTAVILHADHGQSLTEHGYFGHGRYVFDSSQRVPLIVRMPGRVLRGKRVSRQVRNIDILPTVLELAGLQATIPLDGRSLLAPAPSGDRDAEEAYVETYLSANWLFADILDETRDVRMGFRRIGIRTPQWKFVVNDPIPFVDVDDRPSISDEEHARYYAETLYDLVADPGETTNVIAAHSDLGRSFITRVWEHQPRTEDDHNAMPLDEATRSRLKSLGYLAQ